jgi:hypothetical protein
VERLGAHALDSNRLKLLRGTRALEETLAVQEMSRSRHTLGVAITHREGNPHFRHHYSVLSVLNRNGLSDFPGFALTLEALREKEITTDPITGWRYQRTWEEAQMRSEREIRQLEELRRVNIEGYREDEE